MTADILISPCCSKSIELDASNYKLECKSKFNCRTIVSALADNPLIREAHLQQNLNLANDQFDFLKETTKSNNISSEIQQKPLLLQTSQLSTEPTTSSSNQQQQQTSSRSLNNYDNTRRNNLNRNYDSTHVTNTVAQALITRLQRWCCQLFWLTIICVIGCCGEKNNKKTIAEVRRDIFNTTMRRSKDMNELEVQLLRRLTSPSSSMMLRPLRASSTPRKRHVPLSRPPSPGLFPIEEDVERE